VSFFKETNNKMAYKYSKGAFIASGSVSLEDNLTVTGSSTLAAVTATTISGTTSQFTILSASALGGAAVSGISINYVPTFNSVGGTFVDSLIKSDPVSRNISLTASAGTVTLQVSGAATTSGLITAGNGLTVSAGTSALQAVTATTLSASGDVQIGGNLTVGGTYTVVNSTDLYIKDRIITVASGGTDSGKVDGAGITLGSTGYNLKFVSGSMGTVGDSWQFSGSTGFTDFTAGNITGTSLLNTKIVESIESASTATINISKYITLANSTAADITANLPAAGPSFTGVTFKVKNVGTNSVFVKSLGGTIDGVAAATGVTLGTQYAAATFVCDGTNWFIF
jgi:hypothetical protein